MTDKLYEILSELYAERDPDKEWVFWTRGYNPKARMMEEGLFKQAVIRCSGRLAIMPMDHRFRALGASVMDNNGALLPGIQRVIGHADSRSTAIYLKGSVTWNAMPWMFTKGRAARMKVTFHKH